MSISYVRWDDPAVEPPVADEQAKTDSIIQNIQRMQGNNFAEHRHAFRGTHVKTQGIVKGTLTVLPHLPAHLAQGFFKQTGGQQYAVAGRFANEPSKLQDDREPGPRGFSLKLFNTPADAAYLAPEGRQTRSHDFTFNNAPIIELRDVTTCSEIIATRLRHWSNPEALHAALERRPDKELQFAPAGLPNRHFLGMTMYSQAAYRYGDYIVKYALFPTGPLQSALEERDDAAITPDSARDQHSSWIQDFFQHNDASYDFRVQLCRGLEQQSVEDAAMPWDESGAPWETVATVLFPQGQDVMDAGRRKVWDEYARLNPWYGLEEHRPLGSINRLRQRLYQASAAKRGQINGVDVGLLKSIDELP